MVARTRGWLKPARDKPNEELPSISAEMQRQIEADQTGIGKQLKHATEQLALTNVYPGRRGDTRSNNYRPDKNMSPQTSSDRSEFIVLDWMHFSV